MKKYDLIVIGAGAGTRIYADAAHKGFTAAIVEQGPFGGTCLNRGCIPSKMMIHSAEVAHTIDTAQTFGIRSKGYTVDFKTLITRVTGTIDQDAEKIRKAAQDHQNITVYPLTGTFIGPKTLQVGKETITAKNIVIAVGTRPGVPPIPGLSDTDYITSDEAIRLTRQPKVLTIIGGGYIAAELGFFYGALGTKIQLLERSTHLLDREDGEISEAFTRIFSQMFGVTLNVSIDHVEKKGPAFITHTVSKDNKKRAFKSDQLLVATGRRPNSDLLNLNTAGIKMNERGYITVNRYLETTADGVYAIGDIAGNYAFRHSANYEVDYLSDQLYGSGKKKPINYGPVPHAIFSHPQIAGVGMTEEQVQAKNIPYVVARRAYNKTAMGIAMNEQDGFIKYLIDKKTRRILGCHIIGPQSSTLIHEVLPLMRHNRPIDDILDTIHVHPALSELVQRALWDARF